MKKIWLLFGCSFFFSAICAQTTVYSNDIIFTSNSSDTVFITGSLINNASATLLNNGGNIYVKQHLQNNQSSMLPGSGKLWFTGTAQQIISGSAEMRTYNWIVDNAAGIVLQNRIGIGDGSSGNLDFVNGIISSGTNLQDVLFYPNSTYSGYTNTAHIIGYCSKKGSTNFTYPIGDGTYKADLDISALVAETEFQCKYFGNGYGTYTAISPLVSVFDKEYWILDRISGTSGAEITLKWNDSRKALNHSMPSGLRVGHFVSGTGWISEGGSGSGNSSTGTVKSIFVNSFSPFTFASESSVLPVKFSFFKTNAESDCSVNISWVSDDESDVKEYQVQRSKEGINWTSFKTVAVKQNGAFTNSYTVKDENAEKISWFYRIKAVEKNNQFVYTMLSRTSVSCNGSRITIAPTITSSFVWITRNDPSTASILLFDANGKKIQQINGVSDANYKLDLSAFAKGLYYVHIKDNQTTEVYKVVKQ